jgi:GAF domain-containing protein
MGEARLARVLAAYASQPEAALPHRLCGAAADLLTTPGVGLSLASGDSLQCVAATDDAAVGERLQADLGEGPCYDASRDGHPVLVADLAEDDGWLAFTPAALDVGIRAVFSFPLRRGASCLGALDLYRRAPGALSDDEHADALVLARLASDLLVSLQTEMPPRELHELLADPDVATWQVHQATGMVAVQLGVPVADALARLRAHAYVHGLALPVVAAAVVDRMLRLGDGV